MVITTFNYKGESFTAKVPFELLSDEEFESIRKLWYTKFNEDEINAQIYQFSKGRNNINKIVKNYFKDLMEDTKKYYDKWCISDILNCKEMLSLVVAKTKRNDKVFRSNDICENLAVAFSLSGKGMATAISNFPINTCDYILDKYNVNDVYYDYSCGWGVRLLCSLRKGITYYGTDPNTELAPRLNALGQKYNEIVDKRNYKIYCQGSQQYIPELENKVGLAFSSPPYFNLEDYKYGNQSWKNGDSFDEWVENYLRPTFANIYKYLIDDGYFIVNIKDFDNIPLEKTTVEVANECDFKLYTIDGLKQGGRTISVGDNKGTHQATNDENIYVFVKENRVINYNLFDVNSTNEEIITTKVLEKKPKKEIKEIIKEQFEELW